MRRLLRIPVSLRALVLASSVVGCGGGGGYARPDDLVSLTTTSVAPATTGVEYATTLHAIFPHPPGTFSVVAGVLPAGLSLSPESGLLSGYPRQVGTFTFDVAARDGTDPTLPPGRDMTAAEARGRFTLTVSRGAPHLLPQQPPTVQYRRSYAYALDVAGGTPPYRFDLTAGSLPQGLALSPTGLLSGFPTEAGPVPWHPVVTVTDAAGLTDVLSLSLVVVVLPLLIVTPRDLGPVARGFPVDLPMALASPGAGEPYAWRQLPVGPGEVELSSIGLELRSDGRLQNAFGSAGPTAVGTFLFSVEVTDEAHQVAVRQHALRVNAGPVVTSVSPDSAAASGPFTILGQNLQPGARVVFKPGATQTSVDATFVSPTQLTFANALTPVGAVGRVTLRVINPDGGFVDVPFGFAFPGGTVAYSAVPLLPAPQSSLSSTGLDVGDVNRDGYADLVHAGSSSTWRNATGTTAGVDLLVNAPPPGGFTPASPTFVRTQLAVGGDWYAVKLVDVDVDGALDVVAVGRPTGISGTLVARTWRSTFDPVGNPLGPWFTPSVFVDTVLSSQAGTGSGNAARHVADVAFGRVNADALPDLVYTQTDDAIWNGTEDVTGRLTSMAGLGNGAFAALDAVPTLRVNYGSVSGIALGRFDGDALADVAFSDAIGGRPAATGGGGTALAGDRGFVSLTQSDGRFGTTWGALTRPGGTSNHECLGVVAGDLNGDGLDDVVVASGVPRSGGTPNGPLLFTGSPTAPPGVFVASTLPATVPSYRAVALLDADFDQFRDVVLTCGDTRVDVYRGRGGTSGLAYVQSLTLPAGSRGWRVASGDFDRDGREDFAVCLSFLADAATTSGFTTVALPSDRGVATNAGIAIFLNRTN